MEFLIVLDSHGARRALCEIQTRQVRHVDALLFLGDGLRDLNSDAGNVFAVQGNCDLFPRMPSGETAPTEQILQFEGHRILMTHGHKWYVKSGEGALVRHAAEENCDIVLYGHTHTPILHTLAAGELVGERQLDRPMYVFNPGSLHEGSFGTLVLRGTQVLLSHGAL